MRPAGSQIRSDGLTCFSIDRQVQFPPSPSHWRLSQVSNVDPETRTIDEQMDRPIFGKLAEPDVGIGALAAGLTAGWLPPEFDCIF
jgi:hypothetical protein